MPRLKSLMQPEIHLSIPVLHIDEFLVVTDKPADLLSVPAGGPGRDDCLAARIQACWADARIVHRLDAATSGLVLFARGAEMLRRMSLAFEQRVVGKQYLAVVHGHVAHDSGEIDLPLAEDADNRPRQIVDPVRGRRALTRYRVLDRQGTGADAVSRLELKPVTGRAHQLRGQADITLYEAGDYFGGHTHTVDVTLPMRRAPPSRTAWTPDFWCSTSAPTRT